MMVGRLTLLILACLALWVSTSRANEQWLSEAVENGDLLDRQFIAIQPAWWRGEMRIELAAQGQLSDWSLIFSDQEDHSFIVNSSGASERAEQQGDGKRVRLNVPVPTWNAMTVRGTGVTSIKAISVAFRADNVPQQGIDQVKPHSFDAQVEESERLVGLGFGELQLYAAEKRVDTCTAFRVRRGYWLSAAHCVAKISSRPAVTHAYVQPADYADSKVPSSLGWRATIVATGQKGGKWNPAEALRPTDVDYAVLHVAVDPGGPTFELEEVQVTEGQKLQTFMHWPNKPIGKARSIGPKCVVMKLRGTDDPASPEYCYEAMRHGCTTDGSASGGPVVTLAPPHRLIGLHYGAGKPDDYNCAMSVGSIRRDLCLKRSDIAAKVTQCPVK